MDSKTGAIFKYAGRISLGMTTSAKKEGAGDDQISRRESPHIVKMKLKDLRLKAWDGHAHSFYSRDVKERPEFHPVQIFFTALKQGMDFVTITDHDEYAQNEVVTAELKNNLELLRKFIPGTEFTVDDPKLGHIIHVNVYGHSRKDFEILSKLRKDVKSFVRYCEDKELSFQYNHPLWFDLGENAKINEDNFDKILRYARLFPVIEASNSNRALFENLAGEFLANILKRGVTSGSDGHFGDVGAMGYTLAHGDTFKEYWENIVKGNAYLVKQNLAADTLRRYVLETIDYIAFQTDLPKIGKYKLDTGNKTLGTLMSFFDKFPILLRPLRPYVRRKVRLTSLISAYVENQNVVGMRAREYFYFKTHMQQQREMMPDPQVSLRT